MIAPDSDTFAAAAATEHGGLPLACYGDRRIAAGLTRPVIGVSVPQHAVVPRRAGLSRMSQHEDDALT